VELLVASSLTALILTALCGVYFATAQDWERQQGAATALTAVSRACSRLADYIAQATGAQVLTRFASGDTLAINLPFDSAQTGVYAPIWSGGYCQYRSGSWIIFYLSDSTGAYSKPGNILWAATMTWPTFPTSVAPDRSWSMYYSTSMGQTAQLKSIAFSTDTSGVRPTVAISAVASYRIHGVETQLTVSRTICLRNTN